MPLKKVGRGGAGARLERPGRLVDFGRLFSGAGALNKAFGPVFMRLLNNSWQLLQGLVDGAWGASGASWAGCPANLEHFMIVRAKMLNFDKILNFSKNFEFR